MVLQLAAIILGAGAVLVGLYLLALEVQYRRRPGNKLEVTVGRWQHLVTEPQRRILQGEVELINRTQRLEIMVPEMEAAVTLLSKGSLEGIVTRSRIVPCHPDAPARPDDYWFAYIVKTGKRTTLQVQIEIEGADLSQLTTAWVQLKYVTYGPQGRIPRVRHVIIPLTFPTPSDSTNWRMADGAEVLPIRTHLLTPLDTPVEMVKRYVLPHAKPGDIVSIGETPIAVMQDRFYHPTTIQPGWVARRLCYLFLPTSSLATACGMQTLINQVGPLRVLFAFFAGAFAKAVLRRRGVFYQLAGEQARLIDDVTGTLPPYDQFIVLGPEDPEQVVAQIKQETGLEAAIVDVNDLRAVKVLAATAGASRSLLGKALLKNPAGNADEQTPVVLIRPLNG